MFGRSGPKPVHAGLLFQPDRPIADAVAHVVRGLRRVITAIAAQAVGALPITYVRTEVARGDVVRPLRVVVRVGMKVLPVFWKTPASRPVVRSAAVAGRRSETDVTEIFVLSGTPRRGVWAAGSSLLLARVMHIVLNHV